MSNVDKYPKNDLITAWNMIKAANIITLLTHKDPDADGVSACAALAHIFTLQKKQVETIYPNIPTKPLSFQPENISINAHTQIPELIIVCDTANAARMYMPDVFKNIPLINIDHHISNSIKGTLNFVNPTASSTTEELYELLTYWDAFVIDQYVAQALALGIMYDTQVFHTQNTTPQTLRVTADLMERGANIFDLKNTLLTHADPKIYALWGHLLTHITISPSGKAAWASITQQELTRFGLKTPSLVGFSNFLASLAGIDITILFYETADGKTEGSLRSKTSDVNALAGKFGGGGHKNASGFLSDMPMDTLIREMTTGL